MVNYRTYIGLPFLLGLFSSISAAENTCTFTVTDEKYEPSEGCSSDRYYLHEDVLIYYSSSDGCEAFKNPLPGYYINGNGGYIKCSGSGCESFTPTSASCQSPDDDGQLRKASASSNNVILCTKVNKLITDEDGEAISVEESYDGIEFQGTNNRYFVHHAVNGEVFSFDRTKKNVYYAVETKNGKYIRFDPTFTEEDYCANEYGKFMERREDFCSDKSSGMYYTCVNGKCTALSQVDETEELNEEKECKIDNNGNNSEDCASTKNVDGYYIDSNNKLYKYKEGSTSEKVDHPVDGYYWNGHQYNQLIKCSGGSCEAITPPTVFDEHFDYTNYKSQFVDSGYNLVFIDNENIQYTIQELKKDDSFFTKGIVSSAFNNPENYYLIKINDQSLIINEDNPIDNMTIENENGVEEAYECSKGVCTPSKGPKICDPSNPDTFTNCKYEGYYVEKSKLYECTRSDEEEDISCTLVEDTIGYFKAYNNNVIKCALDEEGFIKCTIETLLESTISECEKGKIVDGEVKKLCINQNISEAVELFKSNVRDKYFIHVNFLDAGENSDSKNYYSIAISENKVLPAPTSTTKDEIYWNLGSFSPVFCTKSENVCLGKMDYGNYATEKGELVICDSMGCFTSSSPSDGYYINGASENTKDLIKCVTISSDEGDDLKSCSVESDDGKLGYYISGLGVSPIEIRKLIYCTEDGCEDQLATNGFFYNKNYDSYYKCIIFDPNNPNSVSCEKGEISPCAGTSAGDDGSSAKPAKRYEVTLDDVGLKFCDGTENPIPINSSLGTKYYAISGVQEEGKIDYPNNFIGDGNTDKIVIKVDKYSVTQFVDKNVGICISDNALKDPCNEGDQQYQCTSAKNKCEINVFDTCDPNDKGGKDKYCSGYYYVSNGNKMVLYDCGISGCEEVKEVGYYLISDPNSKVPYVKCTKDGSSAYTYVGLNKPTRSTCSSVGDLVTGSDKGVKLCIDTVNTADLFKADTTVTSYLPERVLNTGSQNANNYNIIKIGPKKVEIVKAEETNNYLYNNKIMICTIDEDVCTMTTSEGYYLSNDTKLISCYDGNCEARSIYGYFESKINTSKYIKCLSTGCTEEDKPTGGTCTDKGVLIKASENEEDAENQKKVIKFCTDNEDSNAFTTFESNLNTKQYAQANIFDTSARPNKYYILSVNATTILPEKISETTNFIYSNNQVMACVKDAMECDLYSQEGYYTNTQDEKQIIHCNSEKNCALETLVGYFKKTIPDDKPYIRCKDSECKEITITDKTCGSGVDIINNDGTVQICVDSTTKVDIFKSTKVDDRFFIPAKILNSAISDVNKYYIVKIDQYSVQKIERTKTTALDYTVFKYTGKSQKIMTRDDEENECPMEGDIEGIKLITEYTRDGEGDTYTKETKE